MGARKDGLRAWAAWLSCFGFWDLEDNQLGKGVFSFRKGSGVALGVPQEHTRLVDPGDTFAANYSLLVRFRREGQVTDLTAKHDGSTPEEALQIALFTPRYALRCEDRSGMTHGSGP